MTTPQVLHTEAFAGGQVHLDLQKIIKVGLHRFRAKQLRALPIAAGYARDADDRMVCNAIRKLVKEQIAFLPDQEWREFAERLFGLTDDTIGQPAKIREQIAGEGLQRPLQPSSVRAAGGMRPALVSLLTQRIVEWADWHNAGWCDEVTQVPQFDLN